MINAKLADYWSDKWLGDADWTEFQKVWPLATMDEKPKNGYDLVGPCRISYEEANALAAMGVRLEITPIPGAMLTKMKEVDDHRYAWDYGTRIDGTALQEGKAVQITVPDMALMYIDEVQVLEDCCTDNLQEHLDEGWRILAVCPPNSARRPDYILGRIKNRNPFK